MIKYSNYTSLALRVRLPFGGTEILSLSKMFPLTSKIAWR
jgi:hypothetical protein